MPHKPSPAFNQTTLESIAAQLACPACMGDLRLEEQELVCAVCGRRYPIVEGIPVLIVDRSTAPSHAVSTGDSLT
ncbi:MAG: Trm112 family protein [Terracidiphilus sp.]|jgi:hypothetical protein